MQTTQSLWRLFSTVGHNHLLRENVTDTQVLGTSIAIFGETATADDGPMSENFTVTIDGGEAYTTSYDDPSPPSYRQWFQSPILSEGSHTIAFTNVIGTPSIDFAVINTTNSIPQQSVIVDDSNLELISYTGAGWTTANTSFLLFQPPLTSKVVPYGNSSHLTAEVGDSFSFNFTGSGARAVIHLAGATILTDVIITSNATFTQI